MQAKRDICQMISVNLHVVLLLRHSLSSARRTEQIHLSGCFIYIAISKNLYIKYLLIVLKTRI